MPLDLTSPADSDLISLGAGEIRSLKTDMQNYLADQQRRRPVLVWVSATTVDVENNTGTAHQTNIPFPDGEVLSVTENTGSATKYRRFDITAVAEFTTGTEDSGLRSGLTEATNTWYAIYAVKSTIDATKFVLAGDTTLPTQANDATLNTRYGTNGWVYLGLIRNGDGGSTTGDILSFVQVKNLTTFTNTTTGANSINIYGGILLATSASAGTLTYTYSAGTSGATIPSNVGIVKYAAGAVTSGDESISLKTAGGVFLKLGARDRGYLDDAWIPASAGIQAEGASATTKDIYINSFYDSVL